MALAWIQVVSENMKLIWYLEEDMEILTDLLEQLKNLQYNKNYLFIKMLNLSLVIIYKVLQAL